jgi:hypothetical protein
VAVKHEETLLRSMPAGILPKKSEMARIVVEEGHIIDAVSWLVCSESAGAASLAILLAIPLQVKSNSFSKTRRQT